MIVWLRRCFYALSLSLILLPVTNVHSQTDTLVKEHSVFFPTATLEKLHERIETDPWAAGVRDSCINRAKPWKELSDEELWQSMFGPTISRSWMVWSNGFCPHCKQPVRMYDWEMDPLNQPWKVTCPHCRHQFPTNDFESYYQSGLNRQGIFDPEKADRSLLYNVDHPDPADSLHLFGVDDGEGYVKGDHRWRFIGAYLVKGLWMKHILTGIHHLSTAYVMTGDRTYAHKTAILLDRIADLYADFDFATQGLVYEERRPGLTGYISTWHDACVEVRRLAMAYDQIYTGLQQDTALVTFLSQKADQYDLETPKTSLHQIQQNIENGIFRETLGNRHKVISNFPQTDLTLIAIQTVLDWPDNRSTVNTLIDRMINKATAADGVSGEKGLASYGAITPKNLAPFFSLYSRLRPGFLDSLFERNPKLEQMYRFHIDTWINESYYPRIGDSGRIGQKVDTYSGVRFRSFPIGDMYKQQSFSSPYSLFWKLYKITGDPFYVKILYRENDQTLSGLPYDLFEDNPDRFRSNVMSVIEKEGLDLTTPSVNKEEWCLGILKSGTGNDTRALWLDYDIGGNHCHADAMNIGFIARGIDLLPGFGYPPVQFGGWYSARAIWYRMTASHNTVVVDGQDQMTGLWQRESAPLKNQLDPLKRQSRGQTTLWCTTPSLGAIRASGPHLLEQTDMSQYERTVALIDIDDQNSYVFDCFRVIGGKDHAKFIHGHMGSLSTTGLSLTSIPDYGHKTLMNAFKGDSLASAGWSADWSVRDVWGYLPDDTEVHLRYIDLTEDAMAATAKTWIAYGYDGEGDGDWLNSLMVRRQAESPLSSVFTGILESYETSPHIKTAQNIPLTTSEGHPYPPMNRAVRIELDNGYTDLIVAMDTENPLKKQPDFGQEETVIVADGPVETDAEFLWIRTDPKQRPDRLVISGGSYLNFGPVSVQLSGDSQTVEIHFPNGKPTLVSGDPDWIQSMVNHSKE
jgi:hypothetical protein